MIEPEFTDQDLARLKPGIKAKLVKELKPSWASLRGPKNELSG